MTGADRHDRIQNNGEKRRLKLKEVQDRLFELLCLIDEICRKEGVTYFLDGGTEIGCVREKDIIPWDDDADIKMKWSEYLSTFDDNTWEAQYSTGFFGT